MDEHNKITVALDESGDLGWSFDHPYRSGGSSRYLTLACVEYQSESKKHIPRFIKKLYEKFKWDTSVEKKWADMTTKERNHFATSAAKLSDDHQTINFSAITVNKIRVQPHIRQDPNTLYNYSLGLLQVNHWKNFSEVILLPDPRSIKVESQNSLSEYLQIKLWFDKGASTKLQTSFIDSKNCKSIQLADMLAGLVQNHFEDGNSAAWNTLKSKIRHKTLFF